MSAQPRVFTTRHVQLLRALFAVAAAVMITFSPDHSAAVGLAVFSGFALTSALVLLLAAWLVYPAGRRWPYVVMGLLGAAAGMAAGVPAWRSDDLFFVLVISWGLSTGIVELIAGLRDRRRGVESARDSVIIAAFGLVLSGVLLLIPAGFTHLYSVKGAGDLVLTGIILGVGMLGVYAALVAVFLGIAGLTPTRAGSGSGSYASDRDASSASHGGER